MSAFDILGTILIGPLKIVFELIFSVAYSVLRQPGPAVVVLSMSMNILLLPLYKRADAIQLEARDTENKLKAVVTHIKKTFSGDERMMILQTYYRQNNYSPLSVLNGSISLMLEIPFFLAAYQFLSNVAVFQNTAFGPITDLSKPDGLLVLGSTAINLLPVIMTLVNVLSSSLYLKDFPLKTKIQLYGMAFFFLVFLYNSPSALVLYWTLNNLFSLFKTLFYRIKNARKVLPWLLAALGTAAFGIGICMNGFWRKSFMVCLGCICQLPWLIPILVKKFPLLQKKDRPDKPNTPLFAMGTLFLTVLVGLLIPSACVSVSPHDYIDIYYFYNPVWYVVHTFCLAAGTFLVWAGVFYWLAKPRLKVLFTRMVWIASGIMVVNYMFFGTNLGILFSDLTYVNGIHFSARETLLNIVLVVILFVVLEIISRIAFRKLTPILLVGTLVLGTMSTINISGILTSAKEVRQQLDGMTVSSPYYLSQNGENVIIMFLDRAFGPFVPYLMEENPLLLEQFDGFTYYANTLSYSGQTIFSSPSLYGGYEYTPVNMNLRDDVPLVSKHNESLKVLPTVFSEAGYDVTLFAPPLAGYGFIPDLSIFDNIENVTAYQEIDKIVSTDASVQIIDVRNYNFFLFSIMKTMPVPLQSPIYQKGNYWSVPASNQPALDAMTADYLSSHKSFQSMLSLADITEDASNTFLFLRTTLTHSPQVLQEPNFEYSAHVDNSDYYPQEGKTISSGDASLLLSTENAISHYHVNMETFMMLGNWFDYLRENNVYDNTKIILVSDHGYILDILDDDDNPRNNIESYLPLLMVKDFQSTGFSVSDAFMTNADTPALAVSHLSTEVMNPFTGRPITSDGKNTTKHHVILTDKCNPGNNNGNQFATSEWATVSGNVLDKSNWVFYDSITVLPPDLNQ